ncbi:hypothetical protein HNR42_002951 [Deinobacterium chartae]|uniref:Uncharacterized protein n=1 Tax=Deinobacterium chartae TaxID=521158 RepID=A0A841I126_9DEIO|nr:hypothetical protein [Deinobacterium chartae]MBB6099501.1 hypothetical protein [Deinobacterium chartae]
MTRPPMVLIAGPCRRGTGDDPEKMSRNLRRLEEAPRGADEIEAFDGMTGLP